MPCGSQNAQMLKSFNRPSVSMGSASANSICGFNQPQTTDRKHDPWLVESMGVEPVDMTGELYEHLCTYL